MGVFLSTALFLIFTLPAQADSSCWESFQTVGHREVWNFPSFASTHIFLPSRNIEGEFISAAAAHFERKESSLQIHFDFESTKMSLPYNLYRLEIVIGSENDSFHYTEDFTFRCEGSGLAIYPGSKIYLPALEIPPHSNGQPRTEESVEIKIWEYL